MILRYRVASNQKVFPKPICIFQYIETRKRPPVKSALIMLFVFQDLDEMPFSDSVKWNIDPLLNGTIANISPVVKPLYGKRTYIPSIFVQ